MKTLDEKQRVCFEEFKSLAMKVSLLSGVVQNSFSLGLEEGYLTEEGLFEMKSQFIHECEEVEETLQGLKSKVIDILKEASLLTSEYK